MVSKKSFTFLASVALAQKALGYVGGHQHGHQNAQKRSAVSDGYCEVVHKTETIWTTVTVQMPATAAHPASQVTPAANTPVGSDAPQEEEYGDACEADDSEDGADDEGEAAAQSSVVPPPAAPVSSTPSASSPTLQAPAEAPIAYQAPPAVESAPAQVEKATDSSSGNKRGLVYNDPTLLSGFLGDGSKCSWTYNWGQTKDNNASLEFVPMLWGPIDLHLPTWGDNANKAITDGSTHLVGFNECDNSGECNMSPADAAAAHIKYMNPFSGKAKIGGPSVTNSNIQGEGLDWLQAFITACAGQCALDFYPIHWYSPPDPQNFLNHLVKAHDIAKVPIWVTEFAPLGTDEENAAFLNEVMTAMDVNPTYSFVERYSYYMVAAGKMISSGTSLNDIGQTFAYA